MLPAVSCCCGCARNAFFTALFLRVIDFVSKSAVFFVLLGLKLLQRVFLDLALLGFGIELELFAIGLNLFYLEFGGIERSLRSRGFALEHSAFGIDAGELAFEPKDFTVAVLEDKKFFDLVSHEMPL